MTTRNVTTPMAPIGARCKLCKLFVDDGDLQIEINYTAKFGKEAGINRRGWICHECATALAGHLTHPDLATSVRALYEVHDRPCRDDGIWEHVDEYQKLDAALRKRVGAPREKRER